MLWILLFGVSTDYGLLIISRYREELHRHEARRDAMAAAVRQALPPVLASAATATIALRCLLAEMNSAGHWPSSLNKPPVGHRGRWWLGARRSHGRWFARSFDRFVVFGADGNLSESDGPVWDETRVGRTVGPGPC